jgi:hypothetical protein
MKETFKRKIDGATLRTRISHPIQFFRPPTYKNAMNKLVYFLFGVVLAFILIALFMKPRWYPVYPTGGYRPNLGPYARHGGGPYRPGILY